MKFFKKSVPGFNSWISYFVFKILITKSLAIPITRILSFPSKPYLRIINSGSEKALPFAGQFGIKPSPGHRALPLWQILFQSQVCSPCMVPQLDRPKFKYFHHYLLGDFGQVTSSGSFSYFICKMRMAPSSQGYCEDEERTCVKIAWHITAPYT